MLTYSVGTSIIIDKHCVTTNIKAYFCVLFQVSQSKPKYLKRFPDTLYDNVKVWSNDDDHGTFITFNLIC